MSRPLFAVLLLTAASLGLSGCALRPRGAEHWEGHHRFDLLPRTRLERLGLSASVIHASASSIGLFYFDRKTELTAEKASRYAAWFCVTEEGTREQPEFCAALSSERCRQGCTMTVPRKRCAGLRLGEFFITNKHCVGEEPLLNPQAGFLDGAGLRRYPLEAARNPDLPYDLLVFRLPEEARGGAAPLLREGLLPRGEPVYTIGFPFLAFRKTERTDYELTNTGMRVALGRIADPNENGLSYCEFSNDDGAKPESWVLEAACGAVKPPGREEKDPLLVDTDMTYGLSGAPLFDREGRLVGIGSTALNDAPENYQPGKYAVYVKAASLQKFLRQASAP